MTYRQTKSTERTADRVSLCPSVLGQYPPVSMRMCPSLSSLFFSRRVFVGVVCACVLLPVTVAMQLIAGSNNHLETDVRGVHVR